MTPLEIIDICPKVTTTGEYNFPFQKTASSTFKPKFPWWDLFGCTRQFISPDPRIVKIFSESFFTESYDPIIYRDVVVSLVNVWKSQPKILLDYVVTNRPYFFEGMFKDKRLEFPISVNQALTTKQESLLELLPITALKFDGELEGPSTNLPQFNSIICSIRLMSNLTEIDASDARFLPDNFYQCLGKVKTLSVRITPENVSLLARLSELKNLTIRFENEGEYNAENTKVLKDLDLEELTLFADRSANVSSYEKCLVNIPTTCSKLRLRVTQLKVEQLQIQFKNRPLKILYLRNTHYSPAEIMTLCIKEVAKKVFVEQGIFN